MGWFGDYRSLCLCAMTSVVALFIFKGEPMNSKRLTVVEKYHDEFKSMADQINVMMHRLNAIQDEEEKFCTHITHTKKLLVCFADTDAAAPCAAAYKFMTIQICTSCSAKCNPLSPRVKRG